MFNTEKFNLNTSIDWIVQAIEKFVIENKTLEHEIKGLQVTLVGEKKKQKWNKVMELFIKNESKQTMFYLFGKITAVRTYQERLKA